MITKLLLPVLLLLLFSVSAFAQDRPKTIINDEQAKEMLLGEHRLSLQWISWNYFGKAAINDKSGTIYLNGEQRSRKNDDYVKVDGIITTIDSREFKFTGTIITKAEGINNGNACKREGEFTFRITGNRKFWRLKEMNNPCEEVVDYVDIYFRQ